MFSRPISALAISESSISALQRAGFENIDEIVPLTAEQLSEGSLSADDDPLPLTQRFYT